MIQDIKNQLDLLSREQQSNGTIRSMAVQALLRNTFGGHKLYKQKRLDKSPGNR